MKDFVKRHPAGAALLVLLLCVCVGTLVGGALGHFVATASAEGMRKADPHDPLDGLVFVAFGFTFVGFVLGAASGLLAGAVVYFTNRRRGGRLP